MLRGLGLPINWIAWCATGEMLGITLAAGIAILANHYLPEPESIPYGFLHLSSYLLSGFMEGTTLAFFQWKGLKTLSISISFKSWLKATLYPALLFWFLGGLPSVIIPQVNSSLHTEESAPPGGIFFFLFISVLGLFLGAIFGAFQSGQLIKAGIKKGNWICANAIGWMIGLTCIFLAATLPDETTPLPIVIFGAAGGGIAAGLAIGVATGFALGKKIS